MKNNQNLRNAIKLHVCTPKQVPSRQGNLSSIWTQSKAVDQDSKRLQDS